MKFPVMIGGMHPHLLFELIGYFVAFGLLMREKKTRGDTVSDENRAWLIVAALFGALLGARILAFMEHFDEFGDREVPIILFGGKTIVGGLLGGTLAIEVTKKFLGITARTGDVYVTPLVFSMAIGRLGCFFTGLEDATYGYHTSLPWGVDFGDGARHPTQLYGIIALFAMWFWLNKNESPIQGKRFQMFMVLYLSWRLLIDFAKDTTTMELLWLTPIQWACIGGLFWFNTKGRPGEYSNPLTAEEES
ncbi:MAG: Prolipoprotein diacylglyceryl transferase [Methanobacteriota archaeon]|nr:MAG: Prolipoprotein diacylglyceryl transferase [Euryarchaeota archaeon]|tara:strand:- start:644 stop:1387 length:744 start_codon:yes stop_codon:yes gene_type:complete